MYYIYDIYTKQEQKSQLSMISFFVNERFCMCVCVYIKSGIKTSTVVISLDQRIIQVIFMFCVLT